MTPPTDPSTDGAGRPRLGAGALLAALGVLALAVVAMSLLGGARDGGDVSISTGPPVATSDAVPDPDPSPPTVTLDMPRDGTRVAPDAAVVLGATLRSGDAEVVDFLVDGEVVGERRREPFVEVWEPPAEGTYHVTVRTTGFDGSVTTSPPVEVTVGGDHACDGVAVGPSDDVQAALDQAGPDAVVCFAEGRYDLAATLAPRNGQTLVAVGEVVLSGARPLPEWRPLGDGRWEATGVDYESPVADGEGCEDSHPRCGYNEDVYADGVRLRHVADADSVGPGAFTVDRTADRIVIGEDPTGRSMEVAVTPAAFRAKARDVSIVGFIVEKFATPHQRGAIDGGTGWRIEANEVRSNHAVGIRTSPGSSVVGNHLHGNGQFGLAGNGTDTVVVSNTLEGNGDILWCCGRVGGSKWVLSEGLEVRGNLARDHLRNGLWTDINNVDVLYEYNVVTDNGLIGLHHEISYDAVIRYNRFERNGFGVALVPGAAADRAGGGVVITASRHVEIHDNEFVGAVAPVLVNQRDRLSDHPSDLGPHETADVSIHDNVFVLVEGARLGSIIGGSSGLDSEGLADAVTFRANTYHVPDPTAPVFMWSNQALDWDGWRRAGNDTDGTLGPLTGTAGESTSGGFGSLAASGENRPDTDGGGG